MKETTKTLIIASICVIVVGFLLYFAILLVQFPQNPSDQKFLVVNVTDGDTFEISTGETIRLICVDTPEKGEAGYKAATDFLASLILDKEVILETDTSDTDSYGRLLRYVYLNETIATDEGLGYNVTFVNKEVVRQGFGTVFRYGNDTSKCDEIGGIK